MSSQSQARLKDWCKRASHQHLVSLLSTIIPPLSSSRNAQCWKNRCIPASRLSIITSHPGAHLKLARCNDHFGRVANMQVWIAGKGSLSYHLVCGGDCRGVFFLDIALYVKLFFDFQKLLVLISEAVDCLCSPCLTQHPPSQTSRSHPSSMPPARMSRHVSPLPLHLLKPATYEGQ